MALVERDGSTVCRCRRVEANWRGIQHPKPPSRSRRFIWIVALAACSLAGCEPIADVSPISGRFGFEERRGSNDIHTLQVVGEFGVGD